MLRISVVAVVPTGVGQYSLCEAVTYKASLTKFLGFEEIINYLSPISLLRSPGDYPLGDSGVRSLGQICGNVKSVHLVQQHPGLACHEDFGSWTVICSVFECLESGIIPKSYAIFQKHTEQISTRSVEAWMLDS